MFVSGSLLLQATRLLLVCGTEMPVLPWVGWGNSEKFEHEREVVNVKSRCRCKQTRNSRKLTESCSAMFQTRQRKEKKAKGGGFSARRDLTQAQFKMAGTVQLAWWSGAIRVPNPPKPPCCPVAAQLLMRPTSRISHPFQVRGSLSQCNNERFPCLTSNPSFRFAGSVPGAPGFPLNLISPGPASLASGILGAA